jgi:uncharacterized membrane protein
VTDHRQVPDTARAVRTPLLRLAHAAEEAQSLDAPVALVGGWARRLLADDRLRSMLRGAPLGHALHPLMTDVPMGLWMSASVLDVAGHPKAAKRLVGLGVLAALPTVATGVADWSVSSDRIRRVGVVHAAGNAIGLVLYSTSWLARRRGNHRSGALAALAGATMLGVGGYLGGHMAYPLGGPPEDPTLPPR